MEQISHSNNYRERLLWSSNYWKVSNMNSADVMISKTMAPVLQLTTFPQTWQSSLTWTVELYHWHSSFGFRVSQMMLWNTCKLCSNLPTCWYSVTIICFATLGNDILSQMTTSKRYIMQVDLTDKNCNKAFAQYDNFVVQSSSLLYKLSGTGTYTGTASNLFANIR